MRFSVVVPVLNEEETLEETLRSIVGQTFRDFELIVVDNGSTDGSVEIAEKYADEVLFEEKKGSINALKRGFSTARGEILVGCDADTVYPPWYLEKLDKAFEDEKTVAVYGPFEFKEKGDLFNWMAVRVYAIFNAFSRLFGVPLAGAANFAVRRSAYAEVGGYRFGDLASQDFRLARELKKIGKVVFLADLTVKTSYRRFEKRGLLKGLIEAFSYWFDVAFGIDKKRMDLYYDDDYYRSKGVRR